jgi:hypothetical protein
MALEYRARKLAVLDEALLSVTQHIERARDFFPVHNPSALNPKPEHFVKIEIPKAPALPRQAELLRLENAYSWLATNYPDLHTSVTEIIAKDQDESPPLQWVVLVEDWDHTYWVVWIYIIWMLWARDGSDFLARHPELSTWMNLMKR